VFRSGVRAFRKYREPCGGFGDQEVESCRGAVSRPRPVTDSVAAVRGRAGPTAQACGHATEPPFYLELVWTRRTDKTRINILWPAAIREYMEIPEISEAVGPIEALGVNDHNVAVGGARTCNCSHSGRMLADVNGEGNVDAFDIAPFVELVFGP